MVNYAIVGGGRLARHFSQYFQLLEISHNCWARDHGSSFNTFEQSDAEERLKETVCKADHVLLLVSDNAIGALLKQYPFLYEKQLIHCSGSLRLAGVAGAHPLMTFTEGLYTLDTYQSIPFVLDTGRSFEQLFPNLPNPHFVVKAEDKARYHAMCVMAGNFSQVLWKGIAERFEQQLEIPAGTLHPYLKQVVDNFITAPETALTGPLARNDQQTIMRNLQSLDGDPLQKLYQAFVHFHENVEIPGTGRSQTKTEAAPLRHVS